MFSGIVEGLAEVKEAQSGVEGLRLSVDLGNYADDVNIGDSISINGACLTVTELDGNLASFDLVAETLEKTCLGDLCPNSKVNIERSLKIGDRLHGHFVLGHVDSVGTISKLEVGEEGGMIHIKTEPTITDQMIPKGSVAVDGISLTIVNLESSSFSIAIIPHTLKMTTLGFKKVGDKVNLEVDMLGKWVQRLVKD